MPRPRYSQVSLDATPYYHCVSRCVRRAYLCGTDPINGNSFEHRRGWIESKMIELAQVFALELCAYTVMSNHYHVVLFVDNKKALAWSPDEVIKHWHQLFNGCSLSKRYINGEVLSQAERNVLDDVIKEWRRRLMDISWFMRCLNETIARQANKEDICTGRFWEGRFKSQALLDEAALAACMAYVDLNPVRAAMAKTPEQSTYTSIKKRIHTAKKAHTANHLNQQVKTLMPFAGNPRQDMPHGLPFRLTDYIELVDWTGRVLRDDKRGHISNQLPPILQRLNIEPKHWHYMAKNFESKFKGLVGTAHKLKQTCENLGYQRTPGLRACLDYFP